MSNILRQLYISLKLLTGSSTSQIIYMEKKEKLSRKNICECITKLQEAAKYRNSSLKGSRYRLKYEPITIYEKAKRAQTEERNLQKSLMLYVESAQVGQKVDSSIKDFASVLHQLGYTLWAVNFLADVREYYQGDLKKFDRLKQNLENQLNPSGKHECTKLLIEFPEVRSINKDLLNQMFENIQRIKKFKVFNDLSFSEVANHNYGRYLLLQFDSFSGAKKTLQKFKFCEWFGVNKYWIKGFQVVCEAQDGRIDFQKGLQLNNRLIKQMLLQNLNSEHWLGLPRDLNWQDIKTTHYLNALSIKIIHDHLSKIENQTLSSENS